ncbi:class I SAM-dependent methyltransferase [Janthinobacterium psychrotolerans]|uniref:Putative O-methyltransferase YrrM n=1 Tax=Janthinobacterium psychrotolerans TaxID=1747903 RepID=A0A1A7C4T9_9BURK|nr:class I SAM-dependent methyltransferase [Janthinobacterium psychrotolerans]OBV40941.1 putative O-methyltransferase YrrM [Janthinobacterium psychrotolerans]
MTPTNTATPQVRSIRPKVLFQQIEAAHPHDNIMFSVSIPSSAIGGMTLLESSILVSLAKLTGALSFFEFGTYMGATSVLLASNAPAPAHITTLDLPPDEIDARSPEGDTAALILQNDTENDNYLRRQFAQKGAFYIDRADANVQSRISRMHLNSRKLDPQGQQLAGQFDFIFIDGAHDYETVAIDTANALAMAKPDAVILWHDYRSNIHGDVTRFVDDFSRTTPVIHVENTMLALLLTGRFTSLLDR